MYNIYAYRAGITRRITQLARKYELGRWRALYGRAPEEQKLASIYIAIFVPLFIIPLVIAFCFFAFLLFALQEILADSAGVFLLACSGLLAWFVIWAIRDARRKVNLCWLVALYHDGCIIQQRTDEPQLFRWREIEAVWQELTRSRRGGEPVYQSYRIQREDGYEVTLMRYGGDLNRVVKTINEHLCERMLPHLLAQYSTGNTVPFGPCSVNKEGFCLENGERQLLPWPRLANVEIEEASLVIYQNSLPACWARIPVATIPNLPLQIALIEEIRTTCPVEKE